MFYYFVTFFLVYFSSSFSLSAYTGTERLLLFLGLFVILVVYAVFKIRSFYQIGLICFCMFLGLLSYTINGESLKSVAILFAYYAIIIAYSGLIDVNTWKETFAKVIYVIALCSVILYFINIIFPNFLNILPITKNSTGVQTHTAFFAIAPIDNRNFGAFWEPGAFQTYLCLALIIELFHYKVANKFRLTVLFIALVTTFSTAGYVTIGFILLAAICEAVHDQKMKRSIVYIVLAVIIAAFASYYIIENVYPELYNTLFGKVETYMSSSTGDTSSVKVRMDSIKYAFELFFKHPVCGVGITGLKDYFYVRFGHQMATCTYANWFAVYGLVYGALMCLGMILFSRFFSKRNMTRFFIVCALFAMITSEDYYLNPSIIVLVAYGLSSVKLTNNRSYKNA